MQVYKFGGASVQGGDAVRNLCKIVSSSGVSPLLLVVSAMGNTTNSLEKVINAHFKQNGRAFQLLEVIKADHFALIDELGLLSQKLTTDVNDIFVEVEWLLEDDVQDTYDYVYDQIAAVGELVSTKIIHAFLESTGLQTCWLDSREILITDENYREARVNWVKSQTRIDQLVLPILEDGQIVVTQGFIGGTLDNNTTTLGREGSDYTGAIFAACLQVESLTVWKNVPGILTADPAQFHQVELLPQLSYEEAIEMTYYGAKVIHPKTIKPLMDQKIPLYVRSFTEPTSSGTIVSDIGMVNQQPITMMMSEQVLVELTTKDFTFVVEDHLSEIFSGLARHQVKLHFMKNQAVTFSMVVNNDQLRLSALLDDLSTSFDSRSTLNLTLVTILYPTTEFLAELKLGKQILIEESNKTMVQLVSRTASSSAAKD